MVQPVDGCEGCNSTGGAYGCVVHSPNMNFHVPIVTVEPFVHLWFRCPCCGNDLVFQGIRPEPAPPQA
ncbi:hypothetical protein LCGC14_1714010 [marine sediment metagenome]|uniref:Uncharacterized protein n=1 Tax=marine sediment metagenome TaxID=412755 RepID=A0A0F9JUX3_9ZZZZ